MTSSIAVPAWTVDSAPFWEGLREHDLRIPFCAACARWFFPPMPGCPACGAGPGDVEFRSVTGSGRVHSWFVAHHAFDPAFADDVPYVVADVTLDEGPRVNARLIGIPADRIRADLPVVATFEDLDGFSRLAFMIGAADEETK